MNTPIEQKQALPRCLRCGGKMLPEGSAGDSACFTCGNVVYLLPPIELTPRRERRPSHGGTSLS